MLTQRPIADWIREPAARQAEGVPSIGVRPKTQPGVRYCGKAPDSAGLPWGMAPAAVSRVTGRPRSTCYPQGYPSSDTSVSSH